MKQQERKCDDCGLPISICNARAMVRIAIEKHGVAAVMNHLDLPQEPVSRLPKVEVRTMPANPSNLPKIRPMGKRDATDDLP